jgi:hypothetical protein
MAAGVEELVVTGSSAGGLATILNVDRIASLTAATRVTGLSDAGFFKYQENHSYPTTVDPWDLSANFSRSMRYVYGMVNASGALSPACRSAQQQQQGRPGATAVPAPKGTEVPLGGEWNCIMAATAIEYVDAPMFVLQSKFDHFQLGAIADIPCMVKQPYTPPWKPSQCSAADVARISTYGADLNAELGRVIAAPSPHRAIFLSACVVHGQSSPAAWSQTTIGNVTPEKAWEAWYNSGTDGVAINAKWIEGCALPCNNNTLVCAPYQPANR